MRSAGSDRKSSNDGPLSSVSRNLALDNGTVGASEEARPRLVMQREETFGSRDMRVWNDYVSLT
jgi:hypothetical protein